MRTGIRVGMPVRFFARWSDRERFGTITRIGFNTIWVGPFCYHHEDVRRLQEWRP